MTFEIFFKENEKWEKERQQKIIFCRQKILLK